MKIHTSSPRKLFSTILLACTLLSSYSTAQNVTIGKQNWTQTNLNVTTFRNGDTIRQAKTAVEWLVAGVYREPAWCYYTNENGVVDPSYGKLYNWYAVNDPRGLAPLGWHIPTIEEWNTLSDFVGEKRGGIKLKTNTGWKDGNGTNASGFSGEPAGRREHAYGKCIGRGSSGSWWSASPNGKEEASAAVLSNNLEYLSIGGHNKMNGFSVRCIEGDVKLKGVVRPAKYFGDSIIGIATRIGNIEVAKFDFPGMLTLAVGEAACAKLGPGWRVPTQKELELVYANRSQIGGFINAHYWYNEPPQNWGFLNFLDFKTVTDQQLEFATAKVRAVRSI